MSVTQQQIVSLLENVLFESPTLAAANEASWAANPAATNISNLATAMAAGPEESIAGHIVGYYLTALGRAPTAAEIRFYVSYAEQGLTSTQIAAGQVPASSWTSIASYFTASPEFAARANLDYSLGATGALLEAVPWLYESVLGRAPSTAEISFYDSLAASGTSLTTLFGYFTGSQEFHTDTASQIANALAAYGAAVASGEQPPASIGASVTLGPPAPPAPPPVIAPSFGALTTGTDTINDSGMSGAHTYQAILGTGATLNNGDSLTGNGLATLDITDNATGGYVLMPSTHLTLSGIETVKLTTGEDAGGTGGNFFDVSGVGGLTAFDLTATGTNGDYITVGSNVAVTASTDSATFLLNTNGTGNTLTLTDPALATLTISAGVSGNVGTITLATTSANSSLILDLLDVTSLHFTDSGNHIANLVINGGVNSSSIAAISDTALTSLSISSGEFLTFGGASAYISLPNSLTTLDTSADSSNVYFNVGGATVTATFGSGNSFIEGSGSGAITLDGNSGSTGAVTVNGFHALTIGTHSYSSVTLAGTGATADITDSSMTSLGIDGLNLTGTLTASSASLTLDATLSAYDIDNITDASLTSLTLNGANADIIFVDTSASTLTIAGNATTSFITDLADYSLTNLTLSAQGVQINSLEDISSTLSITGNALLVPSSIEDLADTSLSSLTLSGGEVDVSLLQTDSGTLSIAGNATASNITGIDDSSLTSLTVSGGKVTFGFTGFPIGLGTSVTSVDLSSDTDTAGTNYFTVNSNNIAITLGTDNNVIDLNSKTGANITVGLAANYSSTAPNLILENVAAGTKLTVGSVDFVGPDSVSSLSQLISDAAANAHGNLQPYVLYSTLGGSDLYIVDVTTTSGTPGNGNTAIIKIVGGAGLEAGISWSGGTFFTL